MLAVADRPLVYMEDVGRHNAVDKIAGWMFKHRVGAADKIFYTTGRLTSEMVIKTVRMGIPILISRSGFTAWGVELARKANLTLIGRARGKRFVALAGEDRIVFDQDLAYVEDESAKHRRKAAVHDRCAGSHASVRGLVKRADAALTLGLVLAGGLARRMGGGDKARIRIGGATILERVLARLKPQCSGVIINANGDPARFADTGLPVVADSVPDFAGPLAGILAGLDWAAANAPEIEWLASVPGDCPFLPRDLVARLHAARAAGGTPLACARSGEWRHPVVGAVAGAAARRSAARADARKACARSRSGPRATASPRRLAGGAVRSVLQRQHAGGRRQRKILRCSIRTPDRQSRRIVTPASSQPLYGAGPGP